MKRSDSEIRSEPRLALPNQTDLIARICWYHFREGQTQQEVADRVGLSRITINKIISEAFKQGYVQIYIDTPLAPCLELERKVKDKYDLKEVIVAPAPADENNVRSIVGIATGEYISKVLQKKQILALSWGGTIYSAAQSLKPRTESNNIVVSLSGGLSRSTVINPYDNAATFARILDAECYYMTAPMFADDRATRNALMNSHAIRTVVDMARRAHIALLTAVDLSPKTWIIKHGALSSATLKSLAAKGAVGAVCDQYLDKNGRLVDHPVNETTVTVPLDIVKKIPNIVLAAGGTFKVPIIRAILAADLVDILITDERAARLLTAD